MLDRLDRWRRRVPFWWWLAYDVLIVLVLAIGWADRWRLPLIAALSVVFAVVLAIDVVEYLVKRRAKC